MTRHQGGTEALFRDAMKPKGLEVEQSTVPTVLELSSSDPSDLKDTSAHLVKVRMPTLRYKFDDGAIVPGRSTALRRPSGRT